MDELVYDFFIPEMVIMITIIFIVDVLDILSGFPSNIKQHKLLYISF